MKDFMILLRGSWKEWKDLGPEETQRLTEMYMDWVDRLRKEGRFKGGAPLSQRTLFLRSEKGRVTATDGPYAETKEALTGYFTIQATSLDEAAEIARGCPALLHGETVEIIPFGHVNQ